MREEEGQLSPSRFLEGQRAERGGRLSPFLPSLDGDKEARGGRPALSFSFPSKAKRGERRKAIPFLFVFLFLERKRRGRGM